MVLSPCLLATAGTLIRQGLCRHRGEGVPPRSKYATPFFVIPEVLPRPALGVHPPPPPARSTPPLFVDQPTSQSPLVTIRAPLIGCNFSPFGGHVTWDDRRFFCLVQGRMTAQGNQISGIRGWTVGPRAGHRTIPWAPVTRRRPVPCVVSVQQGAAVFDSGPMSGTKVRGRGLRDGFSACSACFVPARGVAIVLGRSSRIILGQVHRPRNSSLLCHRSVYTHTALRKLETNVGGLLISDDQLRRCAFLSPRPPSLPPPSRRGPHGCVPSFPSRLCQGGLDAAF